ncbi:response regulator [Roseimaritima ulvae]|uniref:Response regulator rcp1 n=1 Tax=Roseimaritima ulvae TaxID=980254 RepID=A0A5B9QTU6_9BACT|nr:response regulator [Roseimaritima ulvae]QEG42434.1 Response regulator rcp1 [Roseimaritima ulvae]
MADLPIRLLLVDDDELDVMALRRALQRVDFEYELHVANDGVEALEMLQDRTRIPWPFLVFLDVNMPRMSGFEMLIEMRTNPMLSRVPTFVLTTSEADADRHFAFDQRVAGYISKSRTGHGYEKLVEFIQKYWEMVDFPPPLGSPTTTADANR